MSEYIAKIANEEMLPIVDEIIERVVKLRELVSQEIALYGETDTGRAIASDLILLSGTVIRIQKRLTTDIGVTKVYRRLEAMNLELSMQTYTKHFAGMRDRQPNYRISIIEDVAETCKILGRCEEHEMNARLVWFMDMHPTIWKKVIEEQA